MPRQNENNHAEIKFIIKRGDEVKILCPFHLETTVDANVGKWIPGFDGVDILQVLSTQDDDWKNMFCDNPALLTICYNRAKFYGYWV